MKTHQEFKKHSLNRNLWESLTTNCQTNLQEKQLFFNPPTYIPTIKTLKTYKLNFEFSFFFNPKDIQSILTLMP